MKSRFFLNFLLLLIFNVLQAQIEVTNLDDSGTGSLRQAITDAHSLSGLTTITFNSSLDGTITLLSNMPTITSPLVIIGNGVSKTIIDGNDAFKIFEIDRSSLNVSNITMHNMRSGSRGSALYSKRSQVIADNIKLYDYKSTSIFSENESTVKVINSIIENGSAYVFSSDWGSTPVSSDEEQFNNRIYFINTTFQNITRQFSFTHRFVKYDNCTFKNNNIPNNYISYFSGVNRYSVVNCLFENNVMAYAFFHNNWWDNWNEDTIPSDNHNYINNTFRNNTFRNGYILNNQTNEGSYYAKQYTISGNTLINNVDSNGDSIYLLRQIPEVHGPEATIVSNTFDKFIISIEHKNNDILNQLVITFLTSNDLYNDLNSGPTPLQASDISISISGGTGQLDSSSPITLSTSSTNKLILDLNFSTDLDSNELLTVNFNNPIVDGENNRHYNALTEQVNLILPDNDEDEIANINDN